MASRRKSAGQLIATLSSDTLGREKTESEGDPLLSPLERDDFRTNRWRCICWPERAEETLSHWAQLELDLVSAHDLVPSGMAVLAESMNQSFVKVMLDDDDVFETKKVKSLCPKWGDKGALNILTPWSMVRLEVHGQGLMGFVEFNVGDMPYGEELDGWLELRFADNLQRTSGGRYAQHCKVRDDGTRAWNSTAIDTGRTSSDVDDRFTTSRKTRNKNLLGMCCHASPLGSDGYHANAGELRVRMKLVRLGSWTDSLYAMALKPPRQHNFDLKLQEEYANKLNTQLLYDETLDIKLAVLDDGLFCISNYILYIIQWRKVRYSLPLTLLFIATCIYTWLFVVVVPVVAAVGLILNANDLRREEMILGGTNAPLNQEGLEIVAKMRSTAEVKKFIVRIVEVNMEGSTNDDQDLWLTSARVHRDGFPTMTFDQLTALLRDAPWVDRTSKNELREGSLVRVDERHRAVIHELGTNTVKVKYEDDNDNEPVEVKRSKVKKRPETPKVPMVLIPGALVSKIRRIHFFIEDAKRALIPKMQAAADILTWRRKGVAMAITICLLSIAIVGFFACLSDLHPNPDAKPIFLKYVTLVFSRLDNAIVLVAGLVILLSDAWWFKTVRSLFRICSNLVKMRRKAPANWAFYKPAGLDV